MQIYRHPSRDIWNQLTVRATSDYSEKLPVVEEVMQNIRLHGDAAIREYTAKFDRVSIEDLRVSEAEIEQAERALDPALVQAIRTAAANIRTFHEAQITQTNRQKNSNRMTYSA